MKWISTAMFFLFGFFTLTAQTSLQGRLTDADTGEPIVFGTVALYENDVLFTGTETDLDGYYSITEIPAGIYKVVFSYTGYHEKTAKNVLVLEGRANKMDSQLDAGAAFGCSPPCGYRLPLISSDDTTQGFRYASDDLRNLPHRW